MRVAIVGPGAVGEACAHALVATEVARRLVLVGRNVQQANAMARDLRQARAWGRRLDTDEGTLAQQKILLGCDLVVVTLGKRLRGAQDRREVATDAVELFRSSGLVERLAEIQDEPTVVLVVTNPVEASVTWLVEKTGLAEARLFGLGTMVESARTSQHMASILDVDASSTWVHVLGEHGSGIVPVGLGRLQAIGSDAVLKKGLDRARARTLSDAANIRKVSEQTGTERADRLCREFEVDPAVPPELLERLRAELAISLSPPATRFAIAAAVVAVTRALASDADRVLTLAAMPPETLNLPRTAISLPFAVRYGGLGPCLLDPTNVSPELRTVAEELDELARSLPR